MPFQPTASTFITACSVVATSFLDQLMSCLSSTFSFLEATLSTCNNENNCPSACTSTMNLYQKLAGHRPATHLARGAGQTFSLYLYTNTYNARQTRFPVSHQLASRLGSAKDSNVSNPHRMNKLQCTLYYTSMHTIILFMPTIKPCL